MSSVTDITMSSSLSDLDYEDLHDIVDNTDAPEAWTDAESFSLSLSPSILVGLDLGFDGQASSPGGVSDMASLGSFSCLSPFASSEAPLDPPSPASVVLDQPPLPLSSAPAAAEAPSVPLDASVGTGCSVRAKPKSPQGVAFVKLLVEYLLCHHAEGVHDVAKTLGYSHGHVIESKELTSSAYIPNSWTLVVLDSRRSSAPGPAFSGVIPTRQNGKVSSRTPLAMFEQGWSLATCFEGVGADSICVREVSTSVSPARRLERQGMPNTGKMFSLVVRPEVYPNLSDKTHWRRHRSPSGESWFVFGVSVIQPVGEGRGQRKRARSADESV